MERKQNYFTKLTSYLEKFEKILIVKADNVGSGHLQRIRVAVRSLGGEVLMGKNTMMRKAIRGHAQKLGKPELEDLLPAVRKNIGFIMFNGDDVPFRNLVEENRVSAGAKPGSYAPNDVVIPAGLTGLEPTMTGFLQALAIQSKITKGQIEITHDVHLLKCDQRVGPSEATLLGKLNIKPFRYGLIPTALFADGNLTAAEFLNITPTQIVAKLQADSLRPTAISLGLDFPTLLAVPHLLIKSFKDVLALGLESEFKFKQLDELQNAASAAPAPQAVNAPTTQAPAAAAAPEPEPSSEGEVVDLFG